MTAQGGAGDGTGTIAAGAYGDLVRKLRDLDERLGAMVQVYEERPTAFDSAIGYPGGNGMHPEEAVTEVYRLMRNGVFAADSPLRANRSLWDAVREQRDEFLHVYKSARRALEIYAEVLRVYRLLQPAPDALPAPGGVERVRQDKSAQVCERDRCIEAICDLHGKFSALLTVL